MQGRLAWALVATLVGATLAANGIVVAAAAAGSMQDLSRPDPPPAPWFSESLHWFAVAGAVAVAGGLAVPAHAWGNLRAGRRPAATEAVPEERPLAPPGFAGPVVRRRRVGAAQLWGLTLAGLVLGGAGGLLAALSLATLQQTMAMPGRAYDDARLWAGLLRYAALPLLGLAAILVGVAWGRFRFGAVEAVAAPTPRLVTRWQRQ